MQEGIDNFRQDEKIDSADRIERATFFRDLLKDETYSKEENALIEEVTQKFDSLKDANWKKLKSPDIFVDMDFLVNVSSAKSKADKTTAGVGRGES